MKVEHPPLLKYKKHGIECDGHGLLYNSHRRADLATIAKALAYKVTTNSPSTRISKKDRLPEPPEYNKSWWRAQVYLYGLQQTTKGISGSKAILTAAMEKGLEVPAEMNEEEEKLMKHYQLFDVEWNKERARREANYIAATNEKKADTDAERFLRELTVDFVVLREPQNTFSITSWAKKLGLFQSCVERNIWVIGKDKTVVSNEANRIKLEIADNIASTQKACLESFEQQRLELIEAGDGGNVSGKWLLHMPDLDKQYRDGTSFEDGECSMDITVYQEDDEHVWGKLDIVAFKGWTKIHFGGDSKSVGEDWQGREMKMNWEADPEEKDVWEGPFADNVGSVTFRSTTECHGSLLGWMGGPFEFKGFKVSQNSAVTASEVKREYEDAAEVWAEMRHYGEHGEDEDDMSEE